MSRIHIWTNNKPKQVVTTTVKELIGKYTILVDDYRSTMESYIKGTPEYENLRVQAEIFEMILDDLKRLRT